MDKEAVSNIHKTTKVPGNWRTALNVPMCKIERDEQDSWKYRGITLMSHFMKLLERIQYERLHQTVEYELGDEQQGFRKGRGTTDGMFSLGQIVEKSLESQRNMALGFVEL